LTDLLCLLIEEGRQKPRLNARFSRI